MYNLRLETDNPPTQFDYETYVQYGTEFNERENLSIKAVNGVKGQGCVGFWRIAIRS